MRHLVDSLVARVRRVIPQGELSRGVLTLVAGTTIAQGLAILNSPILTRLYTPSDLGALAFFTSIISILLTVTCLSYDYAIPLPVAEDDAASVLVLCLLVSTAMTLVVGITLFAIGPALLAAVGAQALTPFLALIVLVQLVGGYGVAFSRWAIRSRQYSVIAGTTVIQSGTLAIGQVALGVVAAGAGGLLVADLISKVGATASLARAVLRDKTTAVRSVTRAGIREAAGRYRRFPILSTPSALVNTLGLQAPTLLMVTLYGTGVGGELFLAQRVAALPSTLVAQSVGQVYFSAAARVAREDPGQLQPLFLRTTRELARGGIVPTLLVMVASPILFVPLFGADWQDAGWYAAILSPMFFLTLVTSPTGATLDVLERQDLHLTRELLRLVLVGGAVVAAAALALPPMGAVIVLSIAGCLTYCMYGFTSWRAIVSHQRRLAASPQEQP